MSERRGGTLGFDSRAEFLAWIREHEGDGFFAGRTEQDVCDWFVCNFYGPQVLSADFRRGIRALLTGQRQPLAPGQHFPQKNRTIFRLPPSPHWPRNVRLPDAARRLPFLVVNDATELHWRTGDWRDWNTFLFYGDWAELRAAYLTARLILVGADAADAALRVRYIFAGEAHAASLGITEDAERQALEAAH